MKLNKILSSILASAILLTSSMPMTSLAAGGSNAASGGAGGSGTTHATVSSGFDPIRTGYRITLVNSKTGARAEGTHSLDIVYSAPPSNTIRSSLKE